MKIKKIKSHKNHSNAQRALAFLWILLTALILLIVLQQQWSKYYLDSYKLQLHAASKLNLRFTAMIDSFLHEIYSLPLFGRELNDCENDLLPILKSIPKKNPNVLGAFISEKSSIICSTLSQNTELAVTAEESLALYGPILLQNNETVFLLQQRLGQYYLGLYIKEKVFADLLRSSLGNNEFIALYNIKTQTNNLVVGNSLSELQTTESIKTPITHIVNSGLNVTTLPLKPNLDFFYHELLPISGILLLSFLLYLKFRSMLYNRFSLNYALAHALRHNHFLPAYQPIMDTELNQYCGAEVLLRWQTDSNEIIMPDVFITDAEESGLIIPITLQLIAKSLQQSQSLLKSNPKFHLAFNLSAIHFNDNDFLKLFYDLCSVYQIPAQQIMLEITERQLLNQADESLISKMTDLRSRGYSLAIDDFGTGHASFKYLQHFPFNYLKIDQIFIQAIGTGAITETLNNAIIHLAESLHLAIIAEGVETAEQMEFLLKRKVKFAQGWFFAKALAFEELVKLIKKPL
ncbi:MAG: EAL domain-containing protein [Tatlockia sp.]|nr:EAL domain-containing protein [Tatlockia sp.]